MVVRQVTKTAFLVALVEHLVKITHHLLALALLVKDTLVGLVLTVVVQTKAAAVAVALVVLVVIGLMLERQALVVAEFHQASLDRL